MLFRTTCFQLWLEISCSQKACWSLCLSCAAVRANSRQARPLPSSTAFPEEQNAVTHCAGIALLGTAFQ
ncbi:hypothetical protein SKAU_G00026790 [Synaphobranchus kaupii]|uniref:Uncharacterized protein n=1 Tax=Synaphobranchus kaupii TaxID=118154 RepID=A0A9Q1GCV6_SYNKA|nr:hypothetical protein SKAU_G00026790 [Synaphobranchus kaupii]